MGNVRELDPFVRAKLMLQSVEDQLQTLNEMHKTVSDKFFRASKHELNMRRTSILFWFPEIQESEVKYG